MNSYIPKAIDSLLSKFIFFMPGVLIGGYFCRSVLDILIFAVIFSMCTSEIYLAIISKDSKKTRKPDKIAAAARNAFLYRSDDFALDFMFDALKKKHSVERKDGFLSVDGTALVCRIKLTPMQGDALVDLCAYLKSEGFDNAVVLTDRADSSAVQAANNISDIKVRILEFDEVYRLIKALHVTPPDDTTATKPKRSAKAVLRACVCRKRANAYLFAAAVLFIASRFVSYSVYYIVTAAVLLAVSFIARFRKNDETD